jgi:uncharacterized protein (DUF2141 family)
MKAFFCLLLWQISFLFTPQLQDNRLGTLHLKIVQLRNDNGRVNVSLYRSKEGYPGDPDKAYRKVEVQIKEGTCEVVFEDLPLGEYAVSLMHDENRNGKIDTSFLGIPKEGYGASNDAKAVLGPPKYNDARFLLDKPDMTMEIKVKYF